MNKFNAKLGWVSLLALGLSLPVLAEDIDVFVGGANSTQKPNLLIVLDNSSNWSASLAPDTDVGAPAGKQTKFYHEMKALGKVLDALGKCQKDPTTNAIPASCTDANTVGSGINLGLMMFAETGTNGGYARSGLRVMNAANRRALKCMITGNPTTDNLTACPAGSGFVENGSNSDTSAANQPYAKTMFEVFKYFGGYTSPAYATKDQQPPGAVNNSENFGPLAFAGWQTSGTDRRDYKGNTSDRTVFKAFGGATPPYNAGAFTSAGDKAYVNNSVETCGKNFVLFISNGDPGTGGDSGNPNESTLLSNVGGTTTQIKDLSNSTIHASLADEYARFLFQTDVSSLPGQQNVNTYTMAVYDATGTIRTQDQNMIKLMSSMANVGGGNYYEATDGNSLVDGILSAINQMLARDSTFVTATLPVNTNAQGEFLNQVFIGSFRPDANGNPRWWGNVKQYRLACMNGAAEDTACGSGSIVKLVDSSTPPKVIYSAGTAFIDSSVTSYWSTASTFWSNSPKGTSATPTSDAPDGEVVEKGGVAQRMRTDYATAQSARKVLTCAASGNAPTVTASCGAVGSSFANFNLTGTSPGLVSADAAKFFTATTPIPTETDLGSKTTYGDLTAANKSTAFSKLVAWVRGADNITPTDEKGPGGTTTVRPSIHGDVVHSRPVAVDFGGTNGVVLFYGDNHGFLHAVKGTTAAGGGSELWSFIAPEFFPQFARLRANLPALLTPATPGGINPAPQRKDYFFDGSISAYQFKAGTVTKTYLFVTARRGGRFMYAMDVTDPTNPKFLWKIDPTVSGFADIGQTWSAPNITRIPGQTNPVMIFGGGYPGGYLNGTTDACEDASGALRISTGSTNGCNRGYGVYIVDVTNGNLVKWIGGTGISGQTPGTPTTVAMNYAIPSDVYLMDSDFDGLTDRAYVGDLGGRLWRIELSSTTTSDWKAYLLATLPNTNYKVFFRPAVVQQNTSTYVLIGSGDREKPLAVDTADGFFAIKDVVTGALTSASNWTSVSATTDLCIIGAADCETKRGWKIALSTGEKVVNSPRVAFGVANFATNIPKANSAGQCFNNGEARSYQLNFDTGKTAFAGGNDYVVISTGGLAPTAFVGIVDINGKKIPVIIGGGTGDAGVGPTTANTKALNISTTRSKRYWYKAKD